MNWAKIIRYVREQKSLKQDTLACSLGVTRSCVSRWEKGDEEPNLHAKQWLFDQIKNTSRVIQKAVAEIAPLMMGLMDKNLECVAISPSLEHRYKGIATGKSLFEFGSEEWHYGLKMGKDWGLFEGNLIAVRIVFAFPNGGWGQSLRLPVICCGEIMALSLVSPCSKDIYESRLPVELLRLDESARES